MSLSMKLHGLKKKSLTFNNIPSLDKIYYENESDNPFGDIQKIDSNLFFITSISEPEPVKPEVKPEPEPEPEVKPEILAVKPEVTEEFPEKVEHNNNITLEITSSENEQVSSGVNESSNNNNNNDNNIDISIPQPNQPHVPIKNNTLPYVSHFNGPADQGVLLKNKGNNAVLSCKKAMPQKFYPSAGDSMFSNARHAYTKDAGGGTILSGHYDSSQHIYLRKLNAIGKSSTLNPSKNYPLSFRSNENNSRNTALAKCRGGGCVAPKKKGALANPYKSGGRSRVTGTGNRITQIY